MKEEIIFGNYNGEPLVWLPVHKKNENTPYILKHSICKMKFDDKFRGYSDSLIRDFLINEFMPKAFTDEELNFLEGNEKKSGDLVWLIERLKLHEFPVNKKIFKEKAWWIGSRPYDAGEDSWGVIWKFGGYGTSTKNWEYGVRPCIQFKEPPKF